VARISSLFSSYSVAPATAEPAAWGRLIGASLPLAAVELAENSARPVLVLATDPRHADQLEAEIRFFADDVLPVSHFVEWETLPYDSFSPHQDIISRRLQVLAGLPEPVTAIAADRLCRRAISHTR
jgi:transcription-repair coupling factor (superfamily II helicase)